MSNQLNLRYCQFEKTNIPKRIPIKVYKHLKYVQKMYVNVTIVNANMFANVILNFSKLVHS